MSNNVICVFSANTTGMESPRSSRRTSQHRQRSHRGLEGTTGSPSNSPRRRRKHRHSDTNPPTAGVVANGHVNNGEEEDSQISMSALTRGRIPDSFEIEDNGVGRSPPNIAAVPSIACGYNLWNVSPGGSTKGMPPGSAGIATTVANGEVGVSSSQVISNEGQTCAAHVGTTLHNGVPTTQASAMAGISSTGDISEPCNSSTNITSEDNSKEEGVSLRNAAKTDPPPLPPRKYKPKLLAGMLHNADSMPPPPPPRTEASASTTVTSTTPELSVPSHMPPRENQASFDSMEAFAGSHENLAFESKRSSSEASVSTAEQDNNTAESNQSQLPTAQNSDQSQEVIQNDNQLAESLENGHESISEEVAMEEELDVADDAQSDGTMVDDVTEISIDSQDGMTEDNTSVSSVSLSQDEGACGAAAAERVRVSVTTTCVGSTVTTISAQLAKIPTIESAVSHNSYAHSPQHRSSASSASSAHSVPVGSQDSVLSDATDSVQSTGAHIVVTAQPTSEVSSRPVNMAVTRAHATEPTLPSRSSPPGGAHQSGVQHVQLRESVPRFIPQSVSSSPRRRTSAQSSPPVSNNIQRTNFRSNSLDNDLLTNVLQPMHASITPALARLGVTGVTSHTMPNGQVTRHNSEGKPQRRRMLSEEEREATRAQIAQHLNRWHQELEGQTPPPTPPPRDHPQRDTTVPPAPPPREGSILSQSQSQDSLPHSPPTPPPRDPNTTLSSRQDAESPSGRQMIQQQLHRWHQQQQQQQGQSPPTTQQQQEASSPAQQEIQSLHQQQQEMMLRQQQLQQLQPTAAVTPTTTASPARSDGGDIWERRQTPDNSPQHGNGQQRATPVTTTSEYIMIVFHILVISFGITNRCKIFKVAGKQIIKAVPFINVCV